MGAELELILLPLNATSFVPFLFLFLPYLCRSIFPPLPRHTLYLHQGSAAPIMEAVSPGEYRFHYSRSSCSAMRNS